MSGKKLHRTDPAWHPVPEVWAVSEVGNARLIHRIKAAASAPRSFRIHVMTECGAYLLHASLHREPIDGFSECDACLLGDTTYHVVYVVRRPDGEALYVGYSGALVDRIARHRQMSPWWEPGLSVTYTTYPTEDEALQAETDAIAELKPVHNIRALSGRTRSAPTSPTLRADCDTLVQFVADRLGVPAGFLSDRQCATYLGIASSTFFRMRTDPGHAIGGGLVARVMAICGTTTLPEGLFYPASAGEPHRLAAAA